MAASGVMTVASAQAGCQLLSTSFRKESSSDLLESSRQAFPGSPRNTDRLRRAAMPRQTSRSVPATSASLFSMTPGNFMASMIPGNFIANVQEEEVKKDIDEGEDEDGNILSPTNEVLDTINNVMADIVDGQKFLKETGRTKPRPMKRRSLVVCLAMGAIQPYLSEVEDRVTSLRRTASTSFAKTVRLASQLSFGASRAVEYIVEEHRKAEAEQQLTPAGETTMGGILQTTSTSLVKTVSGLVSQASRAASYIAEEVRKLEAEQQQLIPAAA